MPMVRLTILSVENLGGSNILGTSYNWHWFVLGHATLLAWRSSCPCSSFGCRSAGHQLLLTNDCTGTIYKEDWEILDRCHQPGGDPSWAKFQCNSSHVIRDWYGDESCATAHSTVGSQVLSSSVGSCDNNGKMFKCGPLPATKVRLQMYFGSCANAVDNVQAELVRATGCRAKGAAGALSSEKWEVSDGVTTLTEYSTSDCSGTADTTTSFSCSTCGTTGGTEYRPYSCPSTTSTTGATSTAGATIDHAISATAVPFVGLIFGFMFHLDFWEPGRRAERSEHTIMLQCDHERVFSLGRGMQVLVIFPG